MSAVRFNRSLVVGTATVIFLLVILLSQTTAVPQNALQSLTGKLSSRPSFYDIAKKHGTDKVAKHRYEQMYEHRLEPLRDQRIKMLEIGLGCDMRYGPGASYYTWLEFFSNVDLYFIEYDAECAAKWASKTSKAKIFPGDQADEAFLRKFIEQSGGNFDVIIDDGGHTMIQQKTSLKVLWDAVKPGGLYFVEDLNTSYMKEWGGGEGVPDTFMENMRDLLVDIQKNKKDPTKSKIAQTLISLEMTQECVCLTKTPTVVHGV